MRGIVLAAAVLSVVVAALPASASRPVWRQARVTSYATFEPGLSTHTACPSPWGTLRDDGFTVARNYRIGLGCGARIVLRAWDGSRWRVHRATVTDRTLSSFDFEMSWALARAVAPASFSIGSSGWIGGFLTLAWRPA